LDLSAHIRDVPDFPKPGIIYKDITTLLKNSAALDESISMLAAPFKESKIDIVVGIESRGFIFGTPIARELQAGFVPIRKPGKLPADRLSASYELEYGTDEIEIHKDALQPGDQVLLVDDLLATGGTMAAAVDLVNRLNGKIVGISFLIELTFLEGRKKLEGQEIHSLIEY
jgi:adenine phosphoribosyltransferase